MAKKTFYIIDGHAQIYRAYFAPFRELSSPTGEPTKATFVFTQMLMNLVRQRRHHVSPPEAEINPEPCIRCGWFCGRVSVAVVDGNSVAADVSQCGFSFLAFSFASASARSSSMAARMSDSQGNGSSFAGS